MSQAGSPAALLLCTGRRGVAKEHKAACGRRAHNGGCIHKAPPPLSSLPQAKKPVLYVGGGCMDAADEVRELVRLTGIPVAQTLMGLGVYPESDPLSLKVSKPLQI